MGKPNTTFEKRAREQKKREKRLEKSRKKAERELAKTMGPAPVDGEEPPEGSDEAADATSDSAQPVDVAERPTASDEQPQPPTASGDS